MTGKTYRVGTLTYTRGQLIQVFVWLLLGDFCLHLMDNGVIPTLAPLQFEKLGASKTLYNFVAVTLVNFMYVLLVPVVSTWSDRTRTPLGRRRPFLLIASPLLAIVLILLGFSLNIARWMNASMPSIVGGMSVMTLALSLTVGLFVLFKFLDMFPQSVYYYLWPDVIPHDLLGVFGALFRVFYALGSLVFNKFLIGLAKEHPEEIYAGSAVLYLVAFLVLVWRVKEPEYPRPEPRASESGFFARFAGATRAYFVECFSHAFYWKYFLAMAAFQMGYQPFIANLVYYGKQIFGDTQEGLSRYGNVMALKDVLWIGIYLLLVPVMTKLHPLRAGLVGYVLLTIGSAGGFFFIHDPTTFRVFTVLTFVAAGVYLGGTAAIGPKLLPMEKYGQFASAGALVFRLSVALAGLACGPIFDALGIRYVYAWLALFMLIGTILMAWLYIDWKRLGGDEAYTPPK